jgi:hypothetical protein
MTLKRISCPSCGSSNFTHDDEGNLICDMCGVKYASPREEIQCRVCGALNPPDARRCMSCGILLGIRCPVCREINAAGSDHCEYCAAPLDTFSGIVSRMAEGVEGAVAERTERLASHKVADAEYLAAERARLYEEERQRQRRLRALQRQSHHTQNTMLTVVLLLIAGILLAGVAVAVLFMMGIL